MLFTSPSPPSPTTSSSASASSAVGSNSSSPIHLSSLASRSQRYVGERFSLTPSEQECFYSPASSISSVSPTLIKKKAKRFRFPLFMRRASLMSNSDNSSYPQNTAVAINLRPISTPIPVANPAAVAALVDEDEPLATDDGTTAKSLSPSPSLTPKNSINQRRLPGQTLAALYPLNSRKVLLNVGGVRHEGNGDASLPSAISFSSSLANAFASAEYATRTFSQIT